MTSKFTYTHGDSGTKPSSSLDFQSGDAAPPESFDWKWNQTISKINSLIDEVNNLQDGTTKAGDADLLDGVEGSEYLTKSTYDTDDDGIVDNAEQVDGYEATELLQGSGFNVSDFELGAGDFHGLLRVPSVPSNTTLRVETTSLCTDTFGTPSGLQIVVYDATNNTNLATYEAGFNDGTPYDTVAVGGIDLLVAVDNGDSTFGLTGTGSTQTINAAIDAGFR